MELEIWKTSLNFNPNSSSVPMVAVSGICLFAMATQTAGTIQMKHLNCVPQESNNAT